MSGYSGLLNRVERNNSNKDTSGFTPQQRHEVILATCNEFGKGTQAFQLRWRENSGDLLTGDTLLKTPIFWFMKYKWSRSEIEALFFNARVEIDSKFDMALQQTFGGDAGPRWKGTGRISEPQTVRKHKMSRFFENGNQTTQQSATHSSTLRVSSLNAHRLKRFIHSGDKYFKILIEPIPVYRDKLLMIPKQLSLHKHEIVAGTYVNHKIVLLADPYHAYCAASHLEPVDIDHMRASYQKQSQTYNEMLSTVQQQLDDIQKKYIVPEESKQTECAFLSDDEFANNIINCRKANGVDLSDKFIHVPMDDSDPKQIQSAVDLASTRAFASRFVAPITDITKGKAFGEMCILLPCGLTKKYTFNGERVYRGNATFKMSDSNGETTYSSFFEFSCDVFYDDVHFNPIRRASNVDSSKVSFVADGSGVSCDIDDNNEALYEDAAKKLQRKYLNKMNESNKMNKLYRSRKESYRGHSD